MNGETDENGGQGITIDAKIEVGKINDFSKNFVNYHLYHHVFSDIISFLFVGWHFTPDRCKW